VQTPEQAREAIPAPGDFRRLTKHLRNGNACGVYRNGSRRRGDWVSGFLSHWFQASNDAVLACAFARVIRGGQAVMAMRRAGACDDSN
jgi:hypothetical protein